MRARRSPGRRRRWWLVLGVIVVLAAGTGAAAWFATPSPHGLESHVLARLHGTGGRAVPLEQVAPILREAVVATEDERFYQNHGVDLIGVLRALPYDVIHLSFAEGASTITEQLAKLLYLGGNDHSPWRKLEDVALALKLESRYTKEQILDAYLNTAYFGDGAYGVYAASERYFGVPPARLGPARASLLAGLVQAPGVYDPLRHPDLARARQVEVLRSLVRGGFLTAEEGAAVLARGLPLRGGETLPPVRGVELAPGPAFTWWELGVGAGLLVAGAAAFVALRLPRGSLPGALALRLLSLALILLGAGVVVRSFRTV